VTGTKNPGNNSFLWLHIDSQQKQTKFPKKLKAQLLSTPLAQPQDTWSTIQLIKQPNTSDCGTIVCITAAITLQHPNPGAFPWQKLSQTTESLCQQLRDTILATILNIDTPLLYQSTSQDLNNSLHLTIRNFQQTITKLQHAQNTLNNLAQNNITQQYTIHPTIPNPEIPQLLQRLHNINTVTEASRIHATSAINLINHTEQRLTHTNGANTSSNSEITTPSPPISPHSNANSPEDHPVHLQLLGLPNAHNIQQHFTLETIPKQLVYKLPGIQHEITTRLTHATNISLNGNLNTPDWKPTHTSDTALAETFFDAGLYAATKHWNAPHLTLRTVCPLCHPDFTDFRMRLHCLRYDPTMAYPPFHSTPITPAELFTHLRMIAKYHTPHQYILQFLTLQHQTAVNTNTSKLN